MLRVLLHFYADCVYTHSCHCRQHLGTVSAYCFDANFNRPDTYMSGVTPHHCSSCLHSGNSGPQRVGPAPSGQLTLPKGCLHGRQGWKCAHDTTLTSPRLPMHCKAQSASDRPSNSTGPHHSAAAEQAMAALRGNVRIGSEYGEVSLFWACCTPP